jgi:L-ascorbate metabolism protein UlaG (beta-lactamase superfamily)
MPEIISKRAKRAGVRGFVVLFLFVACASVRTEPPPNRPPHHAEGGFRNTDPEYAPPAASTRWGFILRRVWAGFTAPRSFSAPRVENNDAGLRSGLTNPSVTWVGHATLLLQVGGLNILTDPQWNDRASFLSWAGPRRLSPPGLAFDDLPKIDVVVISHDHYDHLDLMTVRRLAEKHDPLFFVPLGLKAWFAGSGINRVEELDWWQEREYRGVKFVCLRTQHFSQRTLWDNNRRLWAAWAIITPDRRFYFGGDAGYSTAFKETNLRLGAFDLAAIAIGTYMPREMMKGSHTTPEEAVQAFLDLEANTLLGIHWGTFDLAEEPLDEPPGRMLAETRRRGIDPERAWIMKIGETRRW